MSAPTKTLAAITASIAITFFISLPALADDQHRYQSYDTIAAPVIDDTVLHGELEHRHTVYGNDRYLYLGWVPSECCDGGSVMNTMLRFDTSNLPSDSPIRHAEIRLDQIANAGYSEMITGSSLVTGDWQEETFTTADVYEHRDLFSTWPVYAPSTATTVAAPRQGGTVAWNVTEQLQIAQMFTYRTDNTADFILSHNYPVGTYPEDRTLFVFASKEGTAGGLHAPVLVIWHGEPGLWWNPSWLDIFFGEEDEEEPGQAELQLLRFSPPEDAPTPSPTPTSLPILNIPPLETSSTPAVKTTPSPNTKTVATPTPSPAFIPYLLPIFDITPTPTATPQTYKKITTPTPTTYKKY